MDYSTLYMPADNDKSAINFRSNEDGTVSVRVVKGNEVTNLTIDARNVGYIKQWWGQV